METYTKTKGFEQHPRYLRDRGNAIAALDLKSIDEPIVDIVSAFARLAHCFPLQSCCGHFICDPKQDILTLDPIPTNYTGSVRYRIAYIAVCIQNSRSGRVLRDALAKIPTLDPANIQFGSADWFWEQFVNSYVLQVEPAGYMGQDEAILDVKEARQVQMVRNLFFKELKNTLCNSLMNQ